MYNFLLALRRLTTMKEREAPETCPMSHRGHPRLSGRGDQLQNMPSPTGKRHSRVNMRRRRSSVPWSLLGGPMPGRRQGTGGHLSRLRRRRQGDASCWVFQMVSNGFKF